MSQLRVLEVLGNSVTGGMERYVGNLLENCPADVAPTVLLPFASQLTERWIACGIPVHFGAVDDGRDFIPSIERIGELARRTNADVIHSHLANANAACTAASAVFGIPALVTIHGRELTQRDAEALALGGARAVVVCDEALAQANELGFGARVRWIPNAVDTRRFVPRERTGGAVTVGFVGRLAPEKGPQIFLSAAACLTRHYRNVTFRLVGDGPLRHALASQIQAGQLGAQVRLEGAIDDMPAAYASFDIVVSTSLSEGTPLAILEAMSCGLPVVATFVGGVRELVCQGVTGALVPPASIEAIAEAVADLIEAPSRRVEWGLAGRRRVERLYSQDAHVAAMRDELHRVARRVPSSNTSTVSHATPLHLATGS
jgi:glycosyltransferase involved in cell wall biosynthesis